MTRSSPTSTKMRAPRPPGASTGAAHQAARAVALAALLGVTGCGSFPSFTSSKPDPSTRLSGIFLEAGAPDAALRAAEDALTRQPRSAAAMLARAEALAELGQVEEAQQAYATAIAANPSAVGPRIALGRMLVQVNPAAAEQVFSEVLVRQPGNAIALNNLGIARDLQGRHIEAQAAYRAARAADPKMTGASVNLGFSQVLAGDMDEAVRTLTPLASLPDAPDAVHENLGMALAASGDATGAARVLGRAMTPQDVTEALAQYRRTAGPMTVAVTPSPRIEPPVQQAAAPLAPMPVAPARTAAPIAAPLARIAAPVADAPAIATSMPVVPPSTTTATSPAPAPTPAPAPAQTAAAAAAPALPVQAQLAAATPTPAPSSTPAPALPVAVPIAVPVAPGTPPAAQQVRRSGDTYVQLAIVPSAARGRSRWETMRSNQTALLGERQLVLAATSYRDQSVWAVRTGPFPTANQAAAFCQRLVEVGQDCWAVIPTPDAPATDAAVVASAPQAAPVPAAPASEPPASVPIASVPAAIEPTGSGPASAPAATADAAPPGRRVAYAQLAAHDNEAAVLREWGQLRQRLGTLLRDRQQLTTTAEVSGRTVWRLRTGPFQQPNEAEAYCAEVRAAGGACWAATGS